VFGVAGQSVHLYARSRFWDGLSVDGPVGRVVPLFKAASWVGVVPVDLKNLRRSQKHLRNNNNGK